VTTLVTPADVRARAKKLFDRDARTWAAEHQTGVVLDVPLRPPTEREALATSSGPTVGRLPGADEGRIEDRVGRPQVATHRIAGSLPRGAVADAIARSPPRGDVWQVLVSRLDALREPGSDVSGVRTHARAIADLDGGDFERLVDVLEWLREHPESGRLVGSCRSAASTPEIETVAARGALHRAGTGALDLGLREPSPLVRLRVLDPSLSFHGTHRCAAPVDDLGASQIRPERVFVFENLATVLAMPDVSGAVAIHGGGHRVDLSPVCLGLRP
jgi:hypothetical protein